MAQLVEDLPAVQETWVRSRRRERPLTPVFWPGSQRVGHDWATCTSLTAWSALTKCDFLHGLVMCSCNRCGRAAGLMVSWRWAGGRAPWRYLEGSCTRVRLTLQAQGWLCVYAGHKRDSVHAHFLRTERTSEAGALESVCVTQPFTVAVKGMVFPSGSCCSASCVCDSDPAQGPPGRSPGSCEPFQHQQFS